MAAPLHVTTRALNGKFVMNKSLSDSFDHILRLQGVSWFMRRAISIFTLTLDMVHTTDTAGVEHIDIHHSLSGGFSAPSENRCLDWSDREEYDDVFGFITERSRRIPVIQVSDEFLKKDWSQDTIIDGIIETQSWTTPGKNCCTWSAGQTWGFAMVNGERRYVRHTTFTSSQKHDGPIHVRLVYDYREHPSRWSSSALSPIESAQFEDPHSICSLSTMGSELQYNYKSTRYL